MSNTKNIERMDILLARINAYRMTLEENDWRRYANN